MIYIVLNLVATFIFIFFTVYTDKKLQKKSKNMNLFLTPLLLACIEGILFSIMLLINHFQNNAIVKPLLYTTFFVNSAFFVTLSVSLFSLGSEKHRLLLRLITIALLGFVIYIESTKIASAFITDKLYFHIESMPLFRGRAYSYFKFDWLFLHDFIIKIFVPILAYLFMMLIKEKENNQLEKYQGVLIGEGIIVMWCTNFFFKFMSATNPAYSCMFIYEYLVLMLVIIYSLSQKAVPSGKSFFATFIKILTAYIIPAGVVAFVVMYLQPLGKEYPLSFIFEFILLGGAALFLSFKFSKIFNSSTRLYTSDYGPALEKALATIDYSEEMDEIINKMYEIFKKNVETSSMSVYISDNKGSLAVAYSSDGLTKPISLSNPIFDVLLNINKSVVIYSELGQVHDISSVEEPLKQFFEDTKSDALFVLNEGRNILGLITLGKKVTGDHFKEYDYSVFTKLYSYFFVFGYYMRNISNKEIISIVNREIKMSSQIITSIQENIDHIKSPKIDSGYLMVPAHNIGGEFIDFIRLTDTRHLFVVGDLSGKGIAASMNMVILKSIIRTYLAETHDFKQLIIKINDFIRTSLRKGTIFAGLFALIDFETDTMYYINCGIPALMLYTQVYNNVIEIQGSGHILGFAKDIAPFISVKTTKLSRGDIILACTDGLVQSHSLRGEQFGKERIQQCILDNSTYPAQRMAQFTFENLMKFMSKEMEDDVSILVLKYESSLEFVEQSANQDWDKIKKENDIKAAISSLNAQNQINDNNSKLPKISDEVQSTADVISNQIINKNVDYKIDAEESNGEKDIESEENVAEQIESDAIEEVQSEQKESKKEPEVEERYDSTIPDFPDNLDDMFKN